jgi:hypothetical protein
MSSKIIELLKEIREVIANDEGLRAIYQERYKKQPKIYIGYKTPNIKELPTICIESPVTKFDSANTTKPSLAGKIVQKDTLCIITIAIIESETEDNIFNGLIYSSLLIEKIRILLDSQPIKRLNFINFIDADDLEVKHPTYEKSLSFKIRYIDRENI